MTNVLLSIRNSAVDRRTLLGTGLLLLLGFGASASADEPKVGEKLPRRGDEIVVCGQLFHTTAPVVLWTDPGGYDAYRVDRRFGPVVNVREKAKVKERNEVTIGFGVRQVPLTPEQTEQVRGGGWDLTSLQNVVDQFVIHYDVAGTSQSCFQVLHDKRGLSVQFMLDLDGTIYQTLDLKEGAWHATKANGRSIGIEIANMGAYPIGGAKTFDEWYRRDSDGQVQIILPDNELKAQHKRGENPTWVPRPSRTEPVVGTIHGQKLQQYDLTPEQYDSLTKLTATLCTVFPKIKCEYPRDQAGALLTKTLPNAEYDRFQGVLGHYHIQTNKTDPGPAFQWDKVIDGARALMAK
ncbi:N-acetylmuramoyl-L-alanine amidase [Singulisphaera acidiphila]|uniref:N-acetylmuramoyl-L-alanine amidase n=1 Tax=Singulisphaera acidiphila (strain ATCC BAA-1392 / DSM 18658 / VKM B-2454 / MOB10) TaxID=886293 RepID=L0DIX9_SINAD|nr:peptidoglycan recognition family protein [Singulisphaera acidiphila]AGA28616.1 negative regulator of beta-lactamase expression [Singulisphaera acidiphila DSM 18658]